MLPRRAAAHNSAVSSSDGGRWQALGDAERLLRHSRTTPRELQYELDRWLEGFVHELRELSTTHDRSRQAGGAVHVLLRDCSLEDQPLGPRSVAANPTHDHVPTVEPFAARIVLQRVAEDSLASQRLDPAANGAVARACLPGVGKPPELAR